MAEGVKAGGSDAVLPESELGAVDGVRCPLWRFQTDSVLLLRLVETVSLLFWRCGAEPVMGPMNHPP